MRTRKVLPFLLWTMLVSVLSAQDAAAVFQKAPPHIDEALRARVTLFYQAHVDGKPRLADAVVHEDSKDAFFAAMKQKYKGFEIVTIKYLENFTRAQVVVAVDGDFVMPGAGLQEYKVPITTLWKMDNGEWWWYVPSAEEGYPTPFGTMKPGPEADAREQVQRAIANMPTVAQIRAQVQVDRAEATLSSYEASSDQVQVVNNMPGSVTLRLVSRGAVPSGYTAAVDPASLGPGEKATVTFHIDPINKYPKPTIRAELHVDPTNAVIPITVRFSNPPDTDPRLLPQN